MPLFQIKVLFSILEKGSLRRQEFWLKVYDHVKFDTDAKKKTGYLIWVFAMHL